jgi:dUTP pyrophosphatase
MLNRQEIEERITRARLIEDAVDLGSQLTPNGVDLTAAQISVFEGAGAIDFSNRERVLAPVRICEARKNDAADAHGWWELAPGVYKIKTNETVNMPRDLIAFAYTRTTLLRMGVSTHHGVWDAGFCGKSEFLMTVHNPAGVRIKQNARVAQLVFVPIAEVAQGYQGIYQHTK